MGTQLYHMISNIGQALHPYVPIRSRSSASQKHPLAVSIENVPLVDLRSHQGDNLIPETRRPRWFDGFHFGTRCCVVAVALVSLLHLILTVTVVSKIKLVGGTAVVQDGDCSTTKRLDIWLHLLINLFSTVLLGSSNYGIQCLSAPTRSDINKAHRQHKWMDIGVPSLRNLKHISWPRALWGLLYFRYCNYVAMFVNSNRADADSHCRRHNNSRALPSIYRLSCKSFALDCNTPPISTTPSQVVHVRQPKTLVHDHSTLPRHFYRGHQSSQHGHPYRRRPWPSTSCRLRQPLPPLSHRLSKIPR